MSARSGGAGGHGDPVPSCGSTGGDKEPSVSGRPSGSAATRWAILAVAAIAAATLAGRPAGLGLTVVACAVFALAARPRNAWSAVWWLLAAALAAVATVRAAGWVVWPSLIASLALGSLAAAGGSSWRQIAARLVPRATLRPFAALVPARGSGLRHPLTGVAIGLLLLAGAARHAAWLPRATVALSAAALLAFAASNPDHRIAERNIERFERSGHIDRDVLRGLSADAAPVFAGLSRTLAGCLSEPLRAELAEPDGLAGLNLARRRARDLLPPSLTCSYAR